MQIGNRNPVELRVGEGELAEYLAQSAAPFGRHGGLQNVAGRADGVETAGERLPEVGAQLIGLEREAADVLLGEVGARDAADPNGRGDGEGGREADDQPHGAGGEAAPRIKRAHDGCPNALRHARTLTGD